MSLHQNTKPKKRSRTSFENDKSSFNITVNEKPSFNITTVDDSNV